MTSKRSKILGSLLGAAMGDSIGAATEFRTTDMIYQHFGGRVTDYVPAPDDNLAKGTVSGHVTDDFSMAYFTAEDMLEEEGRITSEIAKKALVRWYDDGRYIRFIGPTTKKCILKLKGEACVCETPIEKVRQSLLYDSSLVTNGGGMKSGMMGVFNPGDVDGAIDDAITMCSVTHNNTVALAAACAIAAATAKAFEQDASYYDVIQAGFYGASEGAKRTEKTARLAAASNIEKKMGFAVELGLRYQGDFEKAMREISGLIGSGLWAYEAIPAVFGHIAACAGDAIYSILMGVNTGDDTDTIACMTGYIVGALNGAEILPARNIEIINQANQFDLRRMAEKIDLCTEHKRRD